jgi:phosphatidate cytidylyltransferase
MALNVATFKTRTLSAIIFVIVMMAGLLWNQWSFFFLFSLIHFGCWKEYQALMEKIDPDYAGVPLLWTLGFSISGWGGMWWAFRGIPPTQGVLVYAGYVGDACLALGLLLILTSIVLKPQHTGKNVWYALAGLIYLSLPWMAMILLRNLGQTLLDMSSIFGNDPSTYQKIVYPIVLPCALIFSIWINDTMAYIVGSFIGKTPFSKISPKKTWEGTAGGAILCVGVMTLIGHYVGIYRTGVWVIIAVIAAIAGTAGDLLESKIKRMAGVKDSGSILPGHGGFMDRFDSLLLATPLVYLYFVLSAL